MGSASGVVLVLAFSAAVVAVSVAVATRRFRTPPEEKERRRRLAVHLGGRMADGLITDVHDLTVFYSYCAGGVTYTCSQDLSGLRDQLPDRTSLVGPVTVKYSYRNPADSIVLCESWSGLWQRRQRGSHPTESAQGAAEGPRASEATKGIEKKCES